MKKIVYFDMDNVLVDFPSAFERLPLETLQAFEGRLDEVPGIFSLMGPKEGAIEAFEKVSQYYDTYILSTAPWKNSSAWSDKLLWVQNYLGDKAHKRLILSHNKHLNTGDYLIDDRTANGADKFKGQHLHFGTENCPDWEAVFAYLHLPLFNLKSTYDFDDLVAVRKAWIAFDPINILDDEVSDCWDEYDCYLNATLDLMHSADYSMQAMRSFLKRLCTHSMGVTVSTNQLVAMTVKLDRLSLLTKRA